MIYITVELNKPVTIKIPKNITGTPDYKLMMDSQAGGQQFVFQNLNDLGGQSIFKFVLVFETYTPGGTYNYKLLDSLDKVVSKGLIQVNTVGVEDYFYDENELGYFVEDEEGGGDMSNYYTKSQVDSMLTQYEKKSDLPDFNNFVTEEELGEYVTSEELQQEVESYINSKDLINSTQLANTLEWYVTLNELQGMGYITASELPTVNDATITIKQGGEVMGSFTLNQTNNAEILLNEGGQGGGISMNDVKQYVDSQSYVTSDYLTSQSYVTSDYLGNAGYITTDNVRQNYYNKPETEANFTSYAYIEERISRIPGGGITMDEVKQYIVSQSYITSEYLSDQAYITLNDVPVVDLSSYVTYTYLEERLSEYQPSVDLSAYVKYSDLNNYGYITPSVLNACGYATVSQIPVVSNAGIVLRQGGVTKGSFSLNQSTGVTIDFDEGGPGSGVTMEEVKQYVVSQSYVTGSALNNMAYITSNDLTDYATKTYVETKIADIDLNSYITKQDLSNQSYVTSSVLTDYATKAYVQEKINEIPGVDMSSYVSKSDLNNYGYQTSAQVQNIVNTIINSLNSYTLVFTLADDSTVTVIAYTK
jgi:hypothetical protein